MEHLNSESRDPQTHAILGAAMEVHSQLGHGFLEAVYQEAMATEFTLREIMCQREVDLPVVYKGERLKCSYRADFVCFDSVIVELKALSCVGPVEYAQTLNYLKATGLSRALLINFGTPRLEYKRFVWTHGSRSGQPTLATPSETSADLIEREL